MPPNRFESEGLLASSDHGPTTSNNPETRSRSSSLASVKGSSRAAYNGETEISLTRIFDLGASSSSDSLTSAEGKSSLGASNTVAMSSIGQLGRYGNQMLQYIYLRCYTHQRGLDYEVADWVGKHLYGNADPPLSRSYPAVIENKDAPANSTFNETLLEYIAKSNNGKAATEVFPRDLNDADGHRALVGSDVWGWFQMHTKHYAPHKEFIQQIMTPVPALDGALRAGPLARLRSLGKTVVAVHVRRGDYTSISMTSFGYIVPTSWYLEWLDKIWPTLDDPVLFVATDDRTGDVVRDFAAYNPQTLDTLGASMPAEFKDLKAGFYPDHFLMSNADIVAVSNSTFSFTACMLNEVDGARFVRPHWADRFVSFDPWDAPPILHRTLSDNAIRAAIDTLRVVHNTQGWQGVLRNMLVEIPVQMARNTLMASILTVRAALTQLGTVVE